MKHHLLLLMRAIGASTCRGPLDEQDLDAEQLVQISTTIYFVPSVLGPRKYERPDSSDV